MHCGSLLECRLSSAGLPTTTARNRNGRGLRLFKEDYGFFSTSSSASVCCLRAGEFSSCRSPILDWHKLHVCSPTSATHRRRVNSSSMYSCLSSFCYFNTLTQFAVRVEGRLFKGGKITLLDLTFWHWPFRTCLEPISLVYPGRVGDGRLQSSVTDKDGRLQENGFD